jgi:hypothetical protein
VSPLTTLRVVVVRLELNPVPLELMECEICRELEPSGVVIVWFVEPLSGTAIGWPFTETETELSALFTVVPLEAEVEVTVGAGVVSAVFGEACDDF